MVYWTTILITNKIRIDLQSQSRQINTTKLLQCISITNIIILLSFCILYTIVYIEAFFTTNTNVDSLFIFNQSNWKGNFSYFFCAANIGFLTIIAFIISFYQRIKFERKIKQNQDQLEQIIQDQQHAIQINTEQFLQANLLENQYDEDYEFEKQQSIQNILQIQKYKSFIKNDEQQQIEQEQHEQNINNNIVQQNSQEISHIENNQNISIQKNQQTINNSLLSNTNEIQKEFCPICYDEFSLQKKIIRLKCNHEYHSMCIRDWGFQNPKCPLCRQLI
ncbi:hypothetical protein PPERSA_11392 [Pseudocohnilembus persalinus]|uniref:RING-type domain-containing protein n=1 Tax=Pseudocohnilembus persalinus TaxID=266149 RepID=A0A0V0QQ29_PSEPJ|nr:hypothetical protein PPERSA_11392 [Pseudocohnilembus persalinus]|eukprot:KRX04268.1 hypothetical protein PPERSA_11392 [Pseudocohnilembus persalinus]